MLPLSIHVWMLTHGGYPPTPEEMWTILNRALMALDEMEMRVSNSDDMWAELDASP
jgi:hypothetical protein